MGRCHLTLQRKWCWLPPLGRWDAQLPSKLSEVISPHLAPSCASPGHTLRNAWNTFRCCLSCRLRCSNSSLMSLYCPVLSKACPSAFPPSILPQAILRTFWGLLALSPGLRRHTGYLQKFMVGTWFHLLLEVLANSKACEF